ncbi:hypothetical protein HLI01_08940 [Rhizobium laguerreae]|uniref:endonuclease domain-containing protein n=1 Tax=Rhizobium laguerreae TaxID=1076926 RepID=UPI00147823B0|nr:hypothetical protein [Rhizobium laguerreae]
MDGKACPTCGEWKPLDKFHRQSSGAKGRHAYCADCANARKREERRGKPRSPIARRKQLLRVRYGLTPESYDVLFASQDGKCAICQKVPARPCVDHNHVTGQVRGILCHFCNIRLPAVEDDAYRIPASAYLDRYAANDNQTPQIEEAA